MPKNAGHWVKNPFSYRMFKEMTQEEIDEWYKKQKDELRMDQEILTQAIKVLKERLYHIHAIVTKDLKVFYKGKVFQFKTAEEVSYYLLSGIIHDNAFVDEITNDPVILTEKQMLREHIDKLPDHTIDSVTIDNMLIYKHSDKIIAFIKPYRLTYSIEQFKKCITGELIYPKWEFLGNTFNDDLKEILDKSKFSSN